MRKKFRCGASRVSPLTSATRADTDELQPVSADTVACLLLYLGSEEANIVAVELGCLLAVLTPDGVTVSRRACRKRAAGPLFVNPPGEPACLEHLKGPIDCHETQPGMLSLGAFVQVAD